MYYWWTTVCHWNGCFVNILTFFFSALPYSVFHLKLWVEIKIALGFCMRKSRDFQTYPMFNVNDVMSVYKKVFIFLSIFFVVTFPMTLRSSALFYQNCGYKGGNEYDYSIKGGYFFPSRDYQNTLKMPHLAFFIFVRWGRE